MRGSLSRSLLELVIPADRAPAGVRFRSMHLSITIPGDIRAAEAARRAVSAFAPVVGAPKLEVITLVVNELVTNSLIHSAMDGAEIAVTLQANEGRFRGEIRDPGPGFEPPSGDLDPLAPAGRGLFLVSELTDSWGVETNPFTCVWFEMAL